MPFIRTVILLVLFMALDVYMFIRGRKAMTGNVILRCLYYFVFLLATVSFIAGILFSGTLPLKLAIVLRNIAGYWIVLLVFSFLAVCFASVLKTMNGYFPLFRSYRKIHDKKAKRIYFGCVFLLVIVINIVGFIRFSNPQIVELNLPVAKNTTCFKKLTIIAVSDLHLGNVIGRKKLADWIRRINSQQPDLVLLAGDIVDRDFHFKASQDYEKELLKLQTRYGVYAILGNHERYLDSQKVVTFFWHSGIKLLCDQAVTIDSCIVLVGRDDAINARRKLLDSLLVVPDTALPVLLLDHQPILYDAVKNKVDVQLSGHTHNGQIFPLNLILSRIWELSYGYRKIGNTHIYVTSGIGLRVVPIRLGTKSEIVRIQLNGLNSRDQNK